MNFKLKIDGAVINTRFAGHSYSHGKEDICRKCDKVHINPYWKGGICSSKIICQACNKEFAGNISRKYCSRKCALSVNSIKNFGKYCQKENVPWNKDLTKETDERVKKNALNVSITRKRLFKEGKLKRKCYTSREQCIKNFGIYAIKGAVPYNKMFPKKNTRPEKLLQEALRQENIQFTPHYYLFGCPDVFIEPKICVFVDGCWFHGCEKCIDKNKMSSWVRGRKVKDLLITQKLINEGYIVLRFWEHEIYNNIFEVIQKIKYNIPIKVMENRI